MPGKKPVASLCVGVYAMVATIVALWFGTAFYAMQDDLAVTKA